MVLVTTDLGIVLITAISCIVDAVPAVWHRAKWGITEIVVVWKVNRLTFRCERNSFPTAFLTTASGLHSCLVVGVGKQIGQSIGRIARDGNGCAPIACRIGFVLHIPCGFVATSFPCELCCS